MLSATARSLFAETVVAAALRTNNASPQIDFAPRLLSGIVSSSRKRKIDEPPRINLSNDFSVSEFFEYVCAIESLTLGLEKYRAYGRSVRSASL